VATLSCEGIILSGLALFESDKVITVFTREFGMMRLLVKRAQGARFRDKGLIEPLNVNRFIISTGRSFTYYVSADFKRGFLGIRRSLDCLNLAFYFCDLVRKATSDGQANPALYDVLYAALEGIDANQDLSAVLQQFHRLFLFSEGLIDESVLAVSAAQFRQLFGQYTGHQIAAPQFDLIGVE
jgi:DNA repair protein RecO (recombination protein O)